MERVCVLLLYLLMCNSKGYFAFNDCKNMRRAIAVFLLDTVFFAAVLCLNNKIVNVVLAFLYYFGTVWYMRCLRKCTSD